MDRKGSKSWTTTPVKMVSDIFNGATPKSGESSYWDGEVSWVTPADLGKRQSPFISFGQRSITRAGYESCGTTIVPVNSIILSSRAPIGTLGISEKDMCTNQGCKSLVVKNLLNYKFLYYALRISTTQLNLLGRGTTFLELSADELGSYQIPKPSVYEQHQIANFLDHETAKIDTLIDKQQQLIKLLKEKRQAVISHAVTKGLNPHVPLKDSGVEWLGEVPGHWVVRRLKHAATLQSGIPKGKDLTGKATIEVPMLRVANVQDGYLKLDDIHNIKIQPHELERYLLRKGDVLMNEGGDNDKLGRGAIWNGVLKPCIHQNHVFAIRPEVVESEWLDMLTRASYAKFHFYRVAKQSTNLASISSTNIKETPLLIPPKNERAEILLWLDDQSKRFNILEEKALLQVDLLKERRTALISAAVTGIIDVRNWQPEQSQPSMEAIA